MFKRTALIVTLLTLSATSAEAQPGKWKQIYNGQDTTGWEHVGPGGFDVKDGLLTPHGGTLLRSSILGPCSSALQLSTDDILQSRIGLEPVSGTRLRRARIITQVALGKRRSSSGATSA